MAIWATIWATYDTGRLVGATPDGPADRGAGLLDALAARCSAFLRPRLTSARGFAIFAARIIRTNAKEEADAPIPDPVQLHTSDLGQAHHSTPRTAARQPSSTSKRLAESCTVSGTPSAIMMRTLCMRLLTTSRWQPMRWRFPLAAR